MNATEKTSTGSFHKRLRAIRMERGITAKDLAERIGVPESTYREWEYGRPLAGPPFVKIAQNLFVSLTFLMTGEKDSKEWLLNEITELEGRLSELKSRVASRI